MQTTYFVLDCYMFLAPKVIGIEHTGLTAAEKEKELENFAKQEKPCKVSEVEWFKKIRETKHFYYADVLDYKTRN